MGIDIVPVDPLDPMQAARVAAWQAVLEACARVEYGEDHGIHSPDEYRAKFRHQHYERRAAWAGVVDDRVVGHLSVTLPRDDNTHRAELTVAVHPEHRRRGVGTALLATAERVARDDGRTVLGAESDVVTGHVDPAAGFAARHGFADVQREVRSILRLPVADEALAAARAEAEKHADGYETLTSWDGVPDAWLAGRAELSRRMSTDVPLGQLDFNEEEWDAQRVIRTYEVAREQGRRLVETVARHRASGELVAFTTLAVAEHAPEVGYQGDTLVLHEHRGHRLGLLVKTVNLHALIAERPGVRRIHTWNAAENEPMLRVNRALGFTPAGLGTEWQKTLRSGR
jgi:GNAT superfamily N-acetyltransferase